MEVQEAWRRILASMTQGSSGQKHALMPENPAIEITINAIDDAPMLLWLLAQIPIDDTVERVCTNRADDMQDGLDAMAQQHRCWQKSCRAKTPALGRNQARTRCTSTRLFARASA